MNKFKEYFKKDYYRNTGKKYNFFCFFTMPYICKVLYWFRKVQKSPNFISKAIYYSIRNRHGNEIPFRVQIGEGLYLGHLGPRYINSEVIIGKNCNINQNVTIGQENRGKRKGAPTIGDNVWFGANSVVVGKITIGDDVLIAPGAYVNFDVPSHSIVLGNPGKIISKENATESYINNICNNTKLFYKKNS